MAKRARRSSRRDDDQMFLNSILDNIPDMIFVKDAKDLRFVRFNKAGEQLLGRTKKDLIGKNDYDFFPKKEAVFFTRKDRAVLRGRKLVDIPEEPIHTRKRGIRILHTKKIPLFDRTGKPQYLLGISEDITARKNAEAALHKVYEDLETRVHERTAELSRMNKALRESEERYRLLLSSLVEGVVMLDAKGNILSVNPGAERILGYKEKDLIGKSDSDSRWGVLHENGLPAAPKDFFITASLRTGKPITNALIGLRRADGQLVWLNGNTQPLFRPGQKKPYALVASFFDVTSRRRMQAEIQTLNAQLEQKVEQRTSELKAAISELEAFSYSVSHDLRAPLRAIEGFSGILLEDHSASLDEEAKRLLQIVRKNSLHMSKLIDDLLAFSRISRKDFVKKRVPMEDLARVVVEDLRQGQKEAEISIGELPDAFGDTALLRQVWINLLSNAFKFSRQNPSPRIEVGARGSAREIVYYVRDNGVGFDMKYAGKLFGVFQRLHSIEEFEGTGVGLAIVQRIVHKHGGRTWAEGRVNEGATFYFSLPKQAGASLLKPASR
jgi:PAS domain S-box-containing protein